MEETWKIKSIDESQSIQSIKVRAVIINDEGDRRNQPNIGSSGISNQNFNVASRSENKLITSITQSSEQKKKYEDFSRKYIDLKQKLVRHLIN